MKKFALCGLILGLTACQEVKIPKPKTEPQTVEIPVKKVLPKESKWQFDKFIHVTDDNLKKLDNKATVSFTRSESNTGSVGIYSGCNHGGKPIEFDDTNARTIPPKPSRDENYLSTTMGCGDYDKTENAFVTFITQGNSYEFQGENLILTDKKGQKIQFKPLNYK